MLKVIVNQESGESEFTSDKDRIIIGRGTACDIKIVNNSVSREHLEISIKDGLILVKDISSSNWVSYNDEKLSKDDYTEYFDFINLELPENVLIKLQIVSAQEVKQKLVASGSKNVKRPSSRTGQTKTTIKKVKSAKKSSKKKSKKNAQGQSNFVKIGGFFMVVLAALYAYMIRDQLF